MRNLLIYGMLAVVTAAAAPRIEQPWYRSKVPQAAVPKVAVAPTIDGLVDEDEWARALSFTGLMAPGNPYVLPEVMQGRVWVTYDDSHFYVALKSPIPPPFRYAPNGLRVAGEKHDDSGRIESGDHWELRFHEDGPRARPDTMLFYISPSATFSDQRILPEHRGQPRHQSGLEWESGATVKTAIGDRFWTVEMAIPLLALGYENGIPDGQRWRTLFCRRRGYSSMDNAQGEWNGAVAHFMNDQAGLLLFSGTSPAVQVRGLGEMRVADQVVPDIRVHGSGELRPVQVRLTLASGDSVLATQQVDVTPGDETLRLDFAPMPIVYPPDRTARLEIEASAGDDHLYSAWIQLKPLTLADYHAFAEWPYGTWPFASPLHQQWKMDVAHYPSHATLTADVDLTASYLPEPVRQAAVAMLQLHSDEALIREEVIAIADGRGHLQWDNLLLSEGTYTMRGQLRQADGTPIGEPVEVDFVRHLYPWENNRIGISDKVFPPFEPIRVDASRLDLWGRTYELGTCALPGAVTAGDQTAVPGQRIVAPMLLDVVTAAGRERFTGSTTVTAHEPGLVRLQGTGTAAGIDLSVESHLQVDGWYEVTMTLSPREPVDIERLELVAPVGEYADTLWFYRLRSQIGASGLAAGDGLLWNNLHRKGRESRNLFTPVLGVGNGDVAWWWYADSDAAWKLDYTLPSQEIVRQDGDVQVRMALINTPTRLSQPMSLTFAIGTNPCKPDPPDRRRQMWGGNSRIHDTSGYAYWGMGVDAICAEDEAAYRQLKEVIDNWAGDSRPIVLYNSGELIGPSMPGFETFAAEWGHTTPFVPAPEYRDSDVHATVHWRGLTQDWRSKPLRLGPAKADLVQSQIDFRMWHYARNLRELGINGYWWDNASIWPGDNVITGRAYRTADGQLRPGYPTFARRQLNQRLFVLYKEAGVEPFMLINNHTSYAFSQWRWAIEADAYVYRHGGNIFETLERHHEYDIISRVVETDPTPLDPVARFRSHHCMRRLPGAIVSNLDRRADHAIHGTRSIIGLSLLHDFGVESGVHEETLKAIRETLESFDLFDPGVTFLPYWRLPDNAAFSHDQLLMSLYRHPDGQMMAILVNPLKEPLTGRLTLPARTITDAENGSAADGDITIPAREFRLIIAH